jgi:hypothetical protein
MCEKPKTRGQLSTISPAPSLYLCWSDKIAKPSAAITARVKRPGKSFQQFRNTPQKQLIAGQNQFVLQRNS